MSKLWQRQPQIHLRQPQLHLRRPQALVTDGKPQVRQMRVIEAIYLRQAPQFNSSPLSIESVNLYTPATSPSSHATGPPRAQPAPPCPHPQVTIQTPPAPEPEEPSPP